MKIEHYNIIGFKTEIISVPLRFRFSNELIFRFGFRFPYLKKFNIGFGFRLRFHEMLNIGAVFGYGFVTVRVPALYLRSLQLRFLSWVIPYFTH